MPRRTDIHSILVIGAGPIVIGQACEFDYSGTQACQALREEGYRVILVNSNPATIMTDPELADATYIEPITPEFVEKIIEKERPDAVLPTVGGQTALNCALRLAENGVLDKYGVELIGADRDAIDKAENRQRFKEAMDRIGLECPRNIVVHSLEEAKNALSYVGLPAIIRPSFTLGGEGGGIAETEEEFENIVLSGLDASPSNEIQIDESIIGWKEFEMEVVRDKADNAIIICSIENIDPMGVHTGDSITVAPALTLTDKEYQRMRDASLAVLREIGVDTGGSNVQFAVCPKTGRMLVIEMNPRVSRSSALASKATGFPIAKVAAKLAIGYTLDEIKNDCTKVTPASFEPVIDYIVTKIPRFTFEKFSAQKQELSSSMKSIGEAMAIGRSFKESFQKALRSMEMKFTGAFAPKMARLSDEEVRAQLAERVPERLLLVAEAFRRGLSQEDIHAITHYDPWFLEQMAEIVEAENALQKAGLPSDKESLLVLKKDGFSDERIAELTGKKAEEVRALRQEQGVVPVFKRVDTCAAEFASSTAYMYSCYEGDGFQEPECEAASSDKKKVVILGSGPNRIGQGIEFDYACVHAAYAARKAGYESIMINCNPETVSTDYDTSDRLYFEPLTEEDVLEVIRIEQQNGTFAGVNVQFGGQTPLKLAGALGKAGIPIIGTSPDAIDLAEDRDRFRDLLQKLNIQQPANFICHSEEEVKEKASSVGFPVVVRPSYVLGGRAMAILYNAESLTEYLSTYREFFENGPLLVDRFLSEAVEVDVDALSDGEEVFVSGIMEHIEEAGIHSGDSACSLPPYTLSKNIIDQISEHTKALALALNVVGLMNVQYAVKDGEIFVIEVNPRASRTIPFVAKATGMPLASFATRLMLGEKLSSLGINYQVDGGSQIPHVAVKEAVFPFARFPQADVLLGPEMKSTGEVMGIDISFDRAFAKAQLASGNSLPLEGKVFISVKDMDKKSIIPIARDLSGLGFSLIATSGTAAFLSEEGITVEKVNKVAEGSPHIVDAMKNGDIDLVINTTEDAQAISDSFSIRRTALLQTIPYSTTLAGSRALIRAIRRIKEDGGFEVCTLQSYAS